MNTASLRSAPSSARVPAPINAAPIKAAPIKAVSLMAGSLMVALVMVASFMLGGCSSSPTTSPASTSEGKASGPSPSSGAGKDSGPLVVGIVFDSGGRGDKSFNDSAYAGVQRGKDKYPGDDIKTVDSKSEKDYEGNLEALAQGGCNLIFAVGNSQGNALSTVAPKYPDVKFAIVDTVVDKPNVRSLVFEEEQGSFLAGYLAGLVTKTGKIGFVGGMSMPLIKKFEVGYTAGALTANPKVTVLPAKYTESWDDSTLGKASAATLFSQGADIVYHAAGRCGLGVIDAAKEAGKFAIGVDSDQDDIAPGHVLTSMIKHVDEAVFQTIVDVHDGKFSSGTKSYDLKANGVGLSDFKNTKTIIGQANIDKLNAIAEKIKSGEIKAPSDPDQLVAYEQTLKK